MKDGDGALLYLAEPSDTARVVLTRVGTCVIEDRNTQNGALTSSARGRRLYRRDKMLANRLGAHVVGSDPARE
jgi:hypothetical protein